jgi:uncharacterized protein (TIGR03437 family)
MIRHFLLCSAVTLCSTISFAAPAITTGGVVSAASYLPVGFPNSGIAQGSIFLVFGTGLGPATLVKASQYPLGTELPSSGGTSIKVTVAGVSSDAIMVYTSAGQVAAVLPSNTSTGDGTLTVTYNGQSSAPAPIHIVKSTFGLFTLNQGGTGPAVLTTPNYLVNTLFASAKPGDTMILWGTGLGPISASELLQPPPVNMTNLDVKVYVGGKLAQVTYQGRSPCCSGLDQINFVVPSGISGCYVPVAVSVNGVISNFPSMSIAANGGTCSDPQGLGLPASALQNLSGGKDQKVGVIVLSRFSPQFLGLVTVNQDTGTAFFYDYNNTSVLQSRGIAPLNAFGSCSVATCTGGTCVPHTQATGAKALDAGNALTVTRVLDNTSKQLTKTSSGGYSAALGGGSLNGPPDFLNPGDFSISGPGGADIGAFNTKITIGTPLVWENKTNFSTVTRSSDAGPLLWSGGDPNGYVAIVGTSTTDATATTPQVTGTFFCTEKVSVGRFTIPSWVLSAMPASGSLSQGGLTAPNGFLLLGGYPALQTFTAPGLDLGYAVDLNVPGQNVNYK